ncbi:MAG: mechanosensitive ion channel family protein, partial [Gammaproteobacteria bacterium]
DNHLGTVDDIQIFSTVLRTPDNKIVVVPNGSIMNGSIVNFSHQKERRIDIVIGCSYDDDIDKVKEVLADVLSKDERILKEPKPRIALSELADSSVNFIVRPWVKNSEYLDVLYSLLEEIKKRFDQEGISIPYPQSDVHIHNHSE